MKVNKLVDFFCPENYEISLNLNEKKHKFYGKVAILGRQTGSEIRLHAHDLEILSAKIDNEIAEVDFLQNDEISLKTAEKNSQNPEKNFAEKNENSKNFENSEIGAKNLENCPTRKVEIEFAGEIFPNSMNGIYPSYYKINGEKKEIFATQFESHFARRAFPCVDEPAAKAIFNLTLETASNQTVLSNSEVSSQEISGARMTTKFQPTPKMSTYLLAFVVGDLQKFTVKTKRGIAVNIFATPAQKTESLEFAGNIAARVIDFYEKYFGVNYPLAKSDHVALPDFSAGAMENWGLITYRETALLADKNSALASREYVANVIAHELAHQWFGNLVTMKWWNDLWLNESFASLMEYLAIDSLEPDWRTRDSFVASGILRSLQRDSLHGVQSVQQDVTTPDEISTLFDGAIVYSKGQRLLEMLKNFIGEDAFRSGLKKYFAKFQYQNTTANDLWNCLSETSGENIAEIMTPWLTQSGYPIVTARKNGEKIILTQEQFFTDQVLQSEISQKSEKIWPIPLFLPKKSGENSAQKILMRDKTLEISRENFDGIFHLNQGNFAHFIANYDKDLRSEIFQNFANFDYRDRIKFLLEALFLADGGRISATDLLEYFQLAKGETDAAVWSIFSIIFAKLKLILADDEKSLAKLRKLIAEIIAPEMEIFREKWPDDFSKNAHEKCDENLIKLQRTIFSMQIFAEEKISLDKTFLTRKLWEIYQEKSENISEINGNLRPLILQVAVRRGDEKIFAELWRQYLCLSDADLRDDIAAALCTTKNPAQISEILRNFSDTTKIRPQDLFHWCAYLSANNSALNKVWNWLKNSWSFIERVYLRDQSYDTFVKIAGSGLRTADQLREFDDFFAEKKQISALQRAIELSHNEIFARVDFIDKNREKLAQKLSEIN